MKLNNIFSKKTFVLLASSLALCSCSDFLTRDHPTGVTDNDFWKTTDECYAALNQCKYWPTGTMNYQNPGLHYVHMEGMTDNMYWNGNYCNDITNIGNGSLTSSTGGWGGGYVKAVWSEFYVRIRRCCRLLEHLDGAYFIKENERERVRAEAITWRAWYHMQLLLYYGRHDGIPIVTESLSGEAIYKDRNSVEECLDFVNKEFDKVLAINNDEVFPFLWDEDRRDRMCKAYVHTLKMDLNFQFKRYDIAKASAQVIMDSGKFNLYYTSNTDDDPSKNYRDLFRYVGQKNDERIMFRNSGCTEVWARNCPASLSGQGAAGVLKSFVDTYETADGRPLSALSPEERQKAERAPKSIARDPRLYVTLICDGDAPFDNFVFKPFEQGSADLVGKSGACPTGFILKKFLNQEDRSHPWSGSLYFPLYRYAEVLLNYVECLVETGDWQNPDVEKYINMIRNRAGMPNMDKSIYNSQEKVRELYRRERRVELAFEGKRYWDIRRWGIGNEVMSGQVYGAWNPSVNAFYAVEERNCTFPKYDSWPISLTEETANPNISQPQGW